VSVEVLIALLGSFIVILGVFSERIATLPLSSPVLMLLLGLAAGPNGFAWVSMPSSPSFAFLEQTCRVLLAVGLMATAISLPKGNPVRSRHPLAWLLLGLMPIGWLLSALIVRLVLGPPFATALLIGAILIPTDPILARSIASGAVAGKFVPARIRHLLLEESGWNDGLAYPFVLLALSPTPAALPHWALHALLHGVALAVLVGTLAGAAAARAFEAAQARGLSRDAFILSSTLPLSIAIVYGLRAGGSDGVLGAFAGGVSYAFFRRERELEHEAVFQDAAESVLAHAMFFMIGLSLPLEGWAALGWKGPLIAVLILALRRLPIVLVLGRFIGRDIRETLFVGWFGPMGISSVFYAALAMRHNADPQVWTVVSLVVAASSLAHGTTGAWLSMRLPGRPLRQAPSRS
jgi:NhaP-type Na+/H+ or K+/H+ antiporter